MRAYLRENYRFLRRYFQEHLPQYAVLPLEGTYLAWIDCRAAGTGSERLAERLLDQGRLMVSPGTLYGPGGEGFIRLNIACPQRTLGEGLERLRKVLAR